MDQTDYTTRRVDMNFWSQLFRKDPPLKTVWTSFWCSVFTSCRETLMIKSRDYLSRTICVSCSLLTIETQVVRFQLKYFCQPITLCNCQLKKFKFIGFFFCLSVCFSSADNRAKLLAVRKCFNQQRTTCVSIVRREGDTNSPRQDISALYH